MEDDFTDNFTDMTGSKTVFFTNWRPIIGWISAIALALQFIVIPLVGIVFAILGREVNPPSLDITSLITLVTGVLGLGGLRTIEKIKGVNS